MREKILEVINEFLPLEEGLVLNDDDMLEEYGLDSLLFIEIVVELENAFGVEVPDEYLIITELDTFAKIEALLESLINHAEEMRVEVGGGE